MLEKSTKQLNRVSISFSLGLGLGLVLGLGSVLGLVLGLMPSGDIVLKSTVLSYSCVPKSLFNVLCMAMTIQIQLWPRPLVTKFPYFWLGPLAIYMRTKYEFLGFSRSGDRKGSTS